MSKADMFKFTFWVNTTKGVKGKCSILIYYSMKFQAINKDFEMVPDESEINVVGMKFQSFLYVPKQWMLKVLSEKSLEFSIFCIENSRRMNSHLFQQLKPKVWSI